MKHVASFVISPFTNPSGEIVCRVAGWLYGKRIRKNFATHAEAEAERQVFDVQLLQTETGIRMAATRLEDAQLQEAEAAFTRLGGQPRSPEKVPASLRRTSPRGAPDSSRDRV